tara:strand:+ start:1221 stop:1850 length:630 start_codon:yes stop_codon:yes gene_type:complete
MAVEDHIGSRIRSVRGYTSLSRKAFGEKHDMSEATLKAWELSITSIRENSLIRLINAFRKEGIICSKEWIIDGTGSPPYKLSERPDTAENALPNAGNFLAEVEFFLKNNKDPVVFQIQDETMLPFYKPRDYVGGLILKNKKSVKNHYHYLVTLATGEKSVRVLFYDATSKKYLVSKTNPLYQNHQLIIEEKDILEIAEIIWHRKIELSA